MKLNIEFINAFTDSLYKGNPAAVIALKCWLPDKTLQNIATENNLSETAFYVELDDNSYHIRWFSVRKEIDFCGHATLATAFSVFNKNPHLRTLTFYAKAVGNFTVSQQDYFIAMDFPNQKPHEIEEIPKNLTQGLSILPIAVLKNQQAYFAIYERSGQVLDVKADDAIIKGLAPFDVVVTSIGDQYDFISRYFWPANGNSEDPVTGSIHAGLAPYWAEKLQKRSLTAYQASTRGGNLHCLVNENRVIVSGRAVLYLNGQITI